MCDLDLKTDRLTLRGPRLSDLDDMFAIFSDPRAMAYWSTAPHATRAVTREMLNRRIAAWPKHQTYFQIERHGHVIGCAGNHADTEVGFILHPDHWRQGIVSEAMRAIIPHLWHVTDNAELTADVDPLNKASVGLLSSLGFHETHRATRTFCINGTWSDSVYFALRRPS